MSPACDPTSILVVCVVTGALSTRRIIRYTRDAMSAYTIAGGIADEVLRSIRTVKVFGAQGAFAKRFEQHLQTVGQASRKGTSDFSSHDCHHYDDYLLESSSDILVRVLIHRRGARGSSRCHNRGLCDVAGRAFAVDGGAPYSSLGGSLGQRARLSVYPRQLVINHLDLHFPARQVTAIVGPSGSGKSTIFNLIERFYPPVSGRILLDGQDITTLNLKWYRQQLGLVGQEPILTGNTIYESICHGSSAIPPRQGIDDEATKQSVISAAKAANAHDFIMGLPEGYSTKIGEAGVQLSGGQKQRIAIAQALIRHPTVLQLDEATSALDADSERLIKETIQLSAAERTLIIIAHRLSTIKHADNIIVLADGKLVEQGTHSELMARNGMYASLVKAHQAESKEKENAVTYYESVDDSGTTSPKLSHKQSFTEQLYEVDNEKSSDTGERGPSTWTLVKLTASFNRPEASYMTLRLMFSILAGCCNPALAFVLAKAIAVLSLSTSTMSKLKSDASFWSLMMFVIGWANLLNGVTHGILFAYCSEKLTYRARSQAFRSMLSKDVDFFDDEKHQTGSLTRILSIEVQNLAGISGATLGTILATTTMLVAAMAISLAVGWKVALVCGTTIPILLGCGYYRVCMIAAFAQRMHGAHQSSSAFASRAIFSIRAVASLTREEETSQEYEEQLLQQERKAGISMLKSSIPFAAAKSFVFFCVTLAFWYGGTRLSPPDLCSRLHQISAKAKKAARVYHDLLRPLPGIESDATNCHTHQINSIQGSIEFRDVFFSYPSRPPHPVLENLSLSAEPGRFIALVGGSGCGKSTILSLLARLYDPNSGAVLVDGHDLRDLDVHHYRKQLSYVSQEPVLYQGTVRENLSLAVEDEEWQAGEEELIQACKDANLYDFIVSLEDGFSTLVGARGVMLSGGQKQRLAIARALIRRPRILILDEATSALDSASEKSVQEALNKAARGRTTIAIAHRLSTIRHADKIMVIDHGRVVEKGTYSELMAMKGKYYFLARLQGLDLESSSLVS
ncbi:uncharacterized protein Z518_10559 [Rhinocladiella mackenziei CBS 650.93]|uniref:Rhinocladiella mackenziei CBS 650.93 unplaced genomic scaffold supercont1.9, whole genome shotgun sequence n=1 Tax=Rhinocladiella mackenziei CBS 650.93 TaxID=1442369 RepID=A0A0D2IUM6_9EURO|nr:uncharacterized protein Z518_10559 [Rhinocladiella mackenziei CBS 650.93]KIX00420.1 hypothetical protein Z518_10559 [Rhinocladiella mackenziei CBS 650.93]